MRHCANKQCGAPLPVRAHWSARYCSKECRRIGEHSVCNSIPTDDPCAVITELGMRRGAGFFRLATRTPNTLVWWHYPKNASPLPCSVLPALPDAGDYRVILYDHLLNQLPSEEFQIRIKRISARCKITDGSRNVKVYE